MDAVSKLTVHKLDYFQDCYYYAKVNNENPVLLTIMIIMYVMHR